MRGVRHQGPGFAPSRRVDAAAWRSQLHRYVHAADQVTIAVSFAAGVMISR
jgi:hypothetical protein